MKIGILYRDNGPQDVITDSVLSTGAECVNLEMIKSSVIEYDENNYPLKKYLDGDCVKKEYVELIMKEGYKKSNIKEVLKGIDGLVFSGGCDISPTFLANVEPRANNDEKIHASRDISDMLAMQYAIENDIPSLCICRGMQVLGVYSGLELAQHLEDYYSENGKEYKYTHREKEKVDYTRHDIECVDKNSLFYKICGDKLEKNYSWHHQIIKDFNNNPIIKVSAYYDDGDMKIVEAIERTDKEFMFGIQFHPERAINKDGTVQQEDCKKIFKALYNEIERRTNL